MGIRVSAGCTILTGMAEESRFSMIIYVKILHIKYYMQYALPDQYMAAALHPYVIPKRNFVDET